MKKILLCLLVLFFLVSCASVNPFNDERPFIGAIAEDGKYLFTTTDSEAILSLPIKINRVSGSFDPDTGVLFGAIEGAFSKTIVTAGIDASGQFTKAKEDGFTYWTHKESGIQVTVPASDIILFSTSRVKEVYDRTFGEKDYESRLDGSVIKDLFSSVSGLYVNRPTQLPQTDLDLSEAAVERFDHIIIIADTETYDTGFTLTTREYSDSFFKLLKAAYTTMLKKNSQKIDLQYLKQIITQDGTTVRLLDQSLDENYILGIIQNRVNI